MRAAAKAKAKTPKGSRKKGAAWKRAAPAVSLAAPLAEAAWAEADAALAQALVEADEARSAKDEGARAAALDMLLLSLARAARRRGMTRIGEIGARESYDAKRHNLIDSGARAPKTVRVAARGVSRAGQVLAKPRVVRARKARVA
ncbi:MAG: hypothetical protein BroJett013_02720 [Alphaproteobacteria bacterium]|nr:MAG: hypothetical protein BroJett013_02720 [Alphaproteobacteria bacterium]